MRTSSGSVTYSSTHATKACWHKGAWQHGHRAIEEVGEAWRLGKALWNSWWSPNGLRIWCSSCSVSDPLVSRFFPSFPFICEHRHCSFPAKFPMNFCLVSHCGQKEQHLWNTLGSNDSYNNLYLLIAGVTSWHCMNHERTSRCVL